MLSYPLWRIPPTLPESQPHHHSCSAYNLSVSLLSLFPSSAFGGLSSAIISPLLPFVRAPQHSHPFNLSCTQPLAQYFKLISKINFFNWSAVDLQCRVNFCCRAPWFSYTHIYIHILFLNILFHYDLSQDIKYSSLGYTLGPCLLSILHIKVDLCSPPPRTPSLPEPPPPWQPPVCFLRPWFWFCAQRFAYFYTVGPKLSI